MAFLTADPGQVQAKVASLVTYYQKLKKPKSGFPNYTDSAQVWNKYTTEAVDLKIEDLQEKIRETEKEISEFQKAKIHA